MANEKRLIDANEPIKATESTINLLKRQNLPTEAHETFLRWLKSFPTVDAVEVVHAKWENVQNGKGCCSNCHRLDGIDNLATHCRYCGAKMDGGNEE